jgi:hypothetical protein
MRYTHLAAGVFVVVASGFACAADAQESDPENGLEDGRYVATLAAGSAGDHRFSGAAYFAGPGASLSFIILCDGTREFARVRVQMRTRAVGEYPVRLSGRTAAGAPGSVLPKHE